MTWLSAGEADPEGAADGPCADHSPHRWAARPSWKLISMSTSPLHPSILGLCSLLPLQPGRERQAKSRQAAQQPPSPWESLAHSYQGGFDQGRFGVDGNQLLEERSP